jgi:hypothetical protein
MVTRPSQRGKAFGVVLRPHAFPRREGRTGFGSELVFAMRSALRVSARCNLRLGLHKLALCRTESGNRLGRRLRATVGEQRFGARGLVEAAQVLRVAGRAHALELAQIPRLATRALQGREELGLLRVGGVTQAIDRVADSAGFGLLTSGRSERAPAEQHEREQRVTREGLHEAKRRYSTALGGGPI